MRVRKATESPVRARSNAISFLWSLMTALALSLIILFLLLWPVMSEIDLIAEPTNGSAMFICVVTQLFMAGLAIRLFSREQVAAGKKLTPSQTLRIIVILFGVCLAFAGWAMGGGLGLLILGTMSALIIGELCRYGMLMGTDSQEGRWN